MALDNALVENDARKPWIDGAQCEEVAHERLGACRESLKWGKWLALKRSRPPDSDAISESAVSRGYSII